MTSNHTESERSTKTQEIKSYLTHEISVLGKTVPTLAIAAIVMIGGASAAVLSSFGTVSGTADVDQAVDLQGGSGFSFADEQTAGETLIETRTLESNADVTTQIGFKTTCEKDPSEGGSSSNSIEGNKADFSEDCKGIDTEYVEYYDEAGHDHSSYTPSVSEQDATHVVANSGEDFTSIESAVAAADPDDTILVKDGTYGDPNTKRGVLVNKSLTIVSENGPSQTTIEGHTEGVYITAEDVTLEGFTVTTRDSDQSSGEYGETGIRVEDKADGLLIRHNVIEDLKDEHTVSAIGIDMSEGATGESDVTTDGVTIKNNLIQNVNIAQDIPDSVNNDGDDREAYVISFNERVNNADIVQNTVRDIGNSNTRTTVAVTLFEDGGPNPRVGPQNFEIEMNRFSNFQAETNRAIGSIFVGGYENLGSDHNLTQNLIEGGLQRYSQSQGGFDPQSADTLNAPENFFSDGIQTTRNVDASWKYKSDTSIEPGMTDKFGIINEFAINLKQANYKLTTNIVPTGDFEPTSPSEA